MDLISVITGDIVGSRKLPSKSREKMYADMKKFLTSLKADGQLTAFEMFRGDSMQCMVSNKEEVLRVALMIRAWFKSYKTPTDTTTQKTKEPDKVPAGKQDIRLSIGIGKVDFFKKSSLAHSDGEAFHLSGLGLDDLKNSQRKIILRSGDERFNEVMEAISLLLDAVLEKWTEHQAELILFKLKSYKEEQIAREIGISQSAVNQRTKTSQWIAIENLLTWFEKTTKAW